MTAYSAPITPDPRPLLIHRRSYESDPWETTMGSSADPADSILVPSGSGTSSTVPIHGYYVVLESTAEGYPSFPTAARSVSYEYFSRFYAGQDETRPIPAWIPYAIFSGAIDGTAVDHGSTYDSFSDPLGADGGDPTQTSYESGGRWRILAGSPFVGHAFSRKDYQQHHGLLDGGLDAATASTVAIFATRRICPTLEEVAAFDWGPDMTVLPPGADGTYDIVSPGSLVSAELVVMMRNVATDNPLGYGRSNYWDANDRLLIGKVSDLTPDNLFSNMDGASYGLPAAAANMELLAALPIPALWHDAPVAGDGEWSYQTIPLPMGGAPFSPTDGIVVATSPSIMRAIPSFSAAEGWSPDTVPADPWPQRFDGTTKVWPDESEDSWSSSPNILLGVQYVYQPPTYRWVLLSDIFAEFTWTLDPSGWLVHFDGSPSFSNDSPIVSYDWEWSDIVSVLLQPTTGEYPDHQYFSQGPFLVTLTITTEDGQFASVSHLVTLPEMSIDGEYLNDRCAFSGTGVP